MTQDPFKTLASAAPGSWLRHSPRLPNSMYPIEKQALQSADIFTGPLYESKSRYQISSAEVARTYDRLIQQASPYRHASPSLQVPPGVFVNPSPDAQKPSQHARTLHAQPEPFWPNSTPEWQKGLSWHQKGESRHTWRPPVRDLQQMVAQSGPACPTSKDREPALFVAPQGAQKVQLNNNTMAWVDPRGVVLHSWKKTKRGTRGGGHRKRMEMEQTQSGSRDLGQNDATLVVPALSVGPPPGLASPPPLELLSGKRTPGSSHGSDCIDRDSSDGLIPTAAQRMDSVSAVFSKQHSDAMSSVHATELDALAQNMHTSGGVTGKSPSACEVETLRSQVTTLVQEIQYMQEAHVSMAQKALQNETMATELKRLQAQVAQLQMQRDALQHEALLQDCKVSSCQNVHTRGHTFPGAIDDASADDKLPLC